MLPLFHSYIYFTNTYQAPEKEAILGTGAITLNETKLLPLVLQTCRKEQN